MSCCPTARRTFAVLGAAAGFACLAGLFAATNAVAGPHTDQKVDTVLDHKVKALNGAEVDLSKYRGKVVVVVNVASKCGFTGQYKPLQAMHEKYGEKGLVILGFPCNQFGGQEPGSHEEIAAFCEKNYGVEFPLMGKVAVKDTKEQKATPLYQELTAKGTTEDPGPVKWNFEKFLIGRDGRAIARFRSNVAPDSKEFVAAVEKALKAEAPAGDEAKTAEG